MSKEVLRSRSGHRIGTIETDAKGVQTLRDPSGRKLGTYDPRTNKTREVSGHLVGTGNLLMTLIRPF